MICTDTDHYVNTLSTIKKEKEKKRCEGSMPQFETKTKEIFRKWSN